MFPKDAEQQLLHYTCKALCAVVHEKRITALFLSTLFTIIQHHFSNNTGELLFCVPEFLRVHIIFLKYRGIHAVYSCRSPPSDFGSASQLKNRNRRITMKKINLREYYPLYTQDTIVEVPDEVADLLREYKLAEAAYILRTYRHKAYFSLD